MRIPTLLLLFFLSLACTPTEEQEQIEDDRVAINNTELEETFIRLGLKEKRNNLISVSALGNTIEFEWVGDNYELLKYFTNLKSFKLSTNSIDAMSSIFKVLIDSDIISQLESISIHGGVDFREGYFSTVNVWSKFKSIKEVQISGANTAWGIDELPTENLEYFNVFFIPNRYYTFDFNPSTIKVISSESFFGINNFENLINLEQIYWRRKDLPAGINLSKMTKLSVLRFNILVSSKCDRCIIISQETMNNLPNLDFVGNKNEQQCPYSISDDKTKSKLFYPYLYVTGECKTYYELNPEWYEPYFD
tara:strand:+ start:181 stop:1098 length:918 start_codon:yes stop_codon:yes gene_type:complete